jgi:hypothetical protein
MTDEDRTVMSTQDTLLAFSEWLDGEGYMVATGLAWSGDKTHEELARDFIEDWESNPHRATLAGRLGVKFVDALSKALEDASKSLRNM